MAISHAIKQRGIFSLWILALLIPSIQGSSSSNPVSLEISKKETNDEEKLQRAVNAAVDRAVRWLLRQQQKDGSFRSGNKDSPSWARTHSVGATALTALALLSCDLPKNDPVIKKAIAFALKNPVKHESANYEASLILMALDAKGAPPKEREKLAKMSLGERKDYKYPRKFSAKEKGKLKVYARQLITNWSKDRGYWSYNGQSVYHGDLSNTQFAILGLKAAARCGMEVSIKIFEGLLLELLENQEPDGAEVFYEYFHGEPSSGKAYWVEASAKARGWPYWVRHGFTEYPEVSKQYVWGSVTNIGIASIELCVDEIYRRGGKKSIQRLEANMEKTQASLRDGLAWMDQNFSVKFNPSPNTPMKKNFPGDEFGENPFHYYYLYSLERTGTLLSTPYIGRHDWYAEGAAELLRKQAKDGSWKSEDNILDTAFALLFLRRATMPIVSGVPQPKAIITGTKDK